MKMQSMRRIATGFLRGWRVWAGILGLGLMIAWTSGSCRPKIQPGTVDRERPTVPEGVATFVVESSEVAPRIDVVGTVTSEEKVHLSSRIPAYVSEVLVSAGDKVRAGQMLITLDDRELREQLRAAEAHLAQAESEFDRTQRLFETTAATQQALDAARSGYQSAQANVDRAKVMLTYTSIKAPIDSVVTDRRIEVGDLANPGQVLLVLYDSHNMRLEAAAPVRLIDRIHIGQEVDVVLDRPVEEIRGTVTEIVSEIDPATRTQQVRVRLEGPTEEILPGTFGRMWVTLEPREAVIVPAEAVHRVGQLEMVKIADGGTVLRRLVKTRAWAPGRREVLSGLEPGDVILLDAVWGE